MTLASTALPCAIRKATNSTCNDRPLGETSWIYSGWIRQCEDSQPASWRLLVSAAADRVHRDRPERVARAVRQVGWADRSRRAAGGAGSISIPVSAGRAGNRQSDADRRRCGPSAGDAPRRPRSGLAGDRGGSAGTPQAQPARLVSLTVPEARRPPGGAGGGGCAWLGGDAVGQGARIHPSVSETL